MDAADFAQKSNEVYLDAALKTQLGKNHASTGSITCEDCGEDIAPKRLAANPQATRCIECQKEFELKGDS